ncbi:metal ABC transporter ATP-binding protein [Eubacteriales bacterium OttesenSCG-928-N13]|nr:metal ABC transporter ATP-binding protein [Eubacteriales bacterium OttesenSCG-928-N13]
MALLTLNDVCMGYEHMLAVEHVTAVIDAGDYVAIVGENGSGKSTLIKGIAGLMGLRSGSIKLGDGLKQGEIGYLPQQTRAQRDFPASVMEVVLSGCLKGSGSSLFFSKQDKQRAQHEMQRLGILPLKNHCYGELSGGQQQRVLLARALCATEKLLLLDEPMTGLDPAATAELYDQIRMLNRERKVAVLMVSHDVGGALRDATKVLCMHQTMAFFGTVQDFYSSHYSDELTGGDHHHV